MRFTYCKLINMMKARDESVPVVRYFGFLPYINIAEGGDYLMVFIGWLNVALVIHFDK